MITSPDSLTQQVLQEVSRTDDTRLRDIMSSLVTHLHAFVRETRLSETEFRQACALIVRLGQISNAQHNEVVLMAGSLGVSQLVCLQNNTTPQQPSTHQNLLGPFWRADSPHLSNGSSLLRCPMPGMPMHMQARVLDGQGRPVVGAEVDIWHCAADGLYENQPEARAKPIGAGGQVDMNLRGRFTTDEEGAIDFWSIKPAGYPIPTDGVVGPMLQALGRHPMRPAHVHAMIVKPGFKTLITQVYADDDPHLLTDAQFGATAALLGHFDTRHEPPADRPATPTPWTQLRFTFVMCPGASTRPLAPIK